MLLWRRVRGRWGRCAAVGVGAIGIGLFSILPAQEASDRAGPEGGTERAAVDRETAKRWEEFKAAAGRYRIEREGDPPVLLTLRPEPLLRWSNPLRVAFDGGLFLWVAEGRPEVVATVYRYKQPDGVLVEKHELQSLATAPLKATYEGREVWNPSTAGIAPKPVPGAAKPAAEAAGRLRQMRALARQFRASHSANTTGRTASLRLLSQPLFRSESSWPEQSDGALFAFVEGTDPEVLLLLETRPVDGTPAWHYSFARMSGRGLAGWHKDQLVWEVPNTDYSRTNPYTNFFVPIRTR